MFPRGAVLAAALLCFVVSTPASCEPGLLDPGFGTGGKVVTDFLGGHDSALGIVVDRDGNLIVGGYASPAVTEEEDAPAPPGGYERRWAVARYLPDGALDTSFDSGAGWVIHQFARQAFLKPALLDAEGRILSVGQVCDPSIASTCVFTVVRTTSDGYLDADFGDGGVVRVDFGGLYGWASSLVLDPDGRMFAGGTVRVPKPGNDFGDEDFGIAALLPDGTLDPSFGDGGVITTDMGGGGGEDGITALFRRPGGELLAIGYAQIGSENRRAIALAKYRRDGSLASGAGATALVDPGGWLYTSAATLDGHGGIFVAGQLYRSAGHGFAVVRLRSNGTLDQTFGVGGLSLTSFDDIYQTATSAGPAAIVILPDGTIAVAGSVLWATDMSDFAVAYLDRNGVLNPAYGDGGRVVTDFAGALDRAGGAALAPDGRLVVAGAAMSRPGLDDMYYDFALAAYVVPPAKPRGGLALVAGVSPARP
jgi:uncharacterized delta-60 repeat protein